VRSCRVILKSCLVLVSSALSIFGWGEIVEVGHFSEIHHYASDDALIILDIDNTLIEPVQELGSDQWFYHRCGEYKAQGYSSERAIEEALNEWHAVQSLTKVKLVEAHIDQEVHDLQSRHLNIMGLTTRGLAMATRTIQQLSTVGVDLTKTAPEREDLFFYTTQGVLFRGGILFTSGTHKGEALFTFLSRIDRYFPEVVFINDKASHLREIEVFCEKRGIKFTGLRYSQTDERVRSFQPEVAKKQLESFITILSDEEAKRQLALAQKE
jgi:hypothetical protein